MDFFGMNRTQKDEQIKQPNSFAESFNTKVQELKDERQQNFNRYSLEVSPEEYELLNEVTKTTQDPFRTATAYRISKEMNLPFEDVYSNLDSYVLPIVGPEKDKYSSEKWYKSISDNFLIGKNNNKIGVLGNMLMTADAEGNTELADAILKEYQALSEYNNTLMQENAEYWGHDIIDAGMQSVPFTLPAMGLSLIPAVGPLASFVYSSASMAGMEYMDLKAQGVSDKTARNTAMIAGALEGVVEVALGNVAGAIGAKMGESAAGEFLRRNVLDKITSKVAYKMHASGKFRTIANLLGRTAMENLEEGAEEIVQESISIIASAIANEIDDTGYEGMTASEIARDLWENGKGGFLGSILLSSPAFIANTRATVKDYQAVKTAAEEIPSKEVFVKAVTDSPVFEGMSEEQKKQTASEIWETTERRRKEAADMEEEAIAEVYSADESMETIEKEYDENGVEKEPDIPEVYRNNEGGLHFENTMTSENKGVLSVGNPTKENANRYGRIEYTIDEDTNTVTIDQFKMSNHREDLRNDLFMDFAERFTGYNIEWNAKGKLAADIKERLSDMNPRGKENGLSFFNIEEDNENAKARIEVARQIMANTNFSERESIAAVGFFETLAKSLNKDVNTFLNENFGGKIFASEEQAEQSKKSFAEYKTNNVNSFINRGFLNDNLSSFQEEMNTVISQLTAEEKKIISDYVNAGNNVSSEVTQAQKDALKELLNAKPEVEEVVDYAEMLASQKMKGTQIQDGVRAAIYAGENADFSTWVHELAHVYRRALEADKLYELEKAFGFDHGSWTREMEEQFAQSFEEYLRTGKAKNNQLKELFRQIADFIADVYRYLTSTVGGVKLNDDIIKVFEDIVANEDSALAEAFRAVKEVQAENNEVQNDNKVSTKADNEVQAEQKTVTEEPATATNENQLTESTTLDEVTADAVTSIISDESLSDTEKNGAFVNAASEQRDFDIFQIIGEEGAKNLDQANEETIRMDNLNIAKEMETAGKDAKTIRLATGWEKGADGKWKYEIDDEFKLKNNKKTNYKIKRYEDEKKSAEKELNYLLNLSEEEKAKKIRIINDFIKRGLMPEGSTLQTLIDKAKEKVHSAEMLQEYDTVLDPDFSIKKLFEKGREAGDVFDFSGYRLEDILENDKLYEAYPELRKYLISFVKGRVDAIGSYNREDNEILIYQGAVSNYGKFLSTLRHEVQHAIQNIEGFAKGSNTENVSWQSKIELERDLNSVYSKVKSDKELLDKVNEYVKEIKNLELNLTSVDDTFLEKLQEVESIKLNDKKFSALWNELQQIQRKYGLVYTNGVSGLFDFSFLDLESQNAQEALRNASMEFYRNKFDNYQRVAGEVEARNAEHRGLMSVEARKVSLLADTEDVPRNAQIVLFQTDEKTLAGVHNLSEENLKHVYKMGGLANPSLAVIDTDISDFSNFGEISLVAPKTLIAKDLGNNAGTFGADVYTPRYPNINIEVTEKGNTVIKNIIKGIEDDNFRQIVKERIRQAVEDPRPYNLNRALAVPFLLEKGNKDFYVIPELKLDQDEIDFYNKVKETVYDPLDMNAEQKKEFSDMFINKDINKRKEKYPDLTEKEISVMRKMLIDEETGLLNAHLMFDYWNAIRTQFRKAGQIDEYKTLDKAKDIVESKEYSKEFEEYKKEKLASIDKKERIFNGYTPSGNRRWLDHTLENVSKFMKQQAVRGGESMSYGMGSTRARVAPKWTTLKQIADNKNRLVTKDEFETIKAELESTYEELTDIISDGNGFDAGEARLNEALESVNPLSYLKREYDIDFSEDEKDMFRSFVESLKKMPTEYFETKFTRPVYLNEFYGAVVPKTIDLETRTILENAGLKILEYEDGENRSELINQMGKESNGTILFQTSENDLISLAREFENWTQFMEYCEDVVPKADVEKLTKNADTDWYRNLWEMANTEGVTTSQLEQEEYERQKALDEEERLDPIIIDAVFKSNILKKPEMLDTFLQRIYDIQNTDLEQFRGTEEDWEEIGKPLEELQNRIRTSLKHGTWLSNAQRIQGGKSLTKEARNLMQKLIAHNVRQYRALYSLVMDDPYYAVNGDYITNLNEEGRKYGLNKNIENMSIEEIGRYADNISDKKLKEKVQNGTVTIDELEDYVEDLDERTRNAERKQKQNELEIQKAINDLSSSQEKTLLKLYGELISVKAEMEIKRIPVPKEVKQTLKTIDYVNKPGAKLQARYEDLYKQYKDIEKAAAVSGEAKALIKKIDLAKESKIEVKKLVQEQKAIDELKELRKNLVKRAMRKVSFDTVDYDTARAIIAVQQIFNSNLKNDVNEWIGKQGATAREIWSEYKTGTDEERKAMEKRFMRTQRTQDLFRKLRETNKAEELNDWKEKDIKALERLFTKSNWYKELQLDRLKEGRDNAIQLDIKERIVGRTSGFNADGSEYITPISMAEYSDEVAELVENNLGSEILEKITYKPFNMWSISEMEDFVAELNQARRYGRDKLNAKKLREEMRAARLRDYILNTVRDTGIVINNDDSEKVKAKKQEKINKILGLSRTVKGTFDDHKTETRLNQILHGYMDANIRRVARILDNYNEGNATELLYWRENECFNVQERSKDKRISRIEKIIKENNISIEDLYETRDIILDDGVTHTLTVDEILFFAQADRNNNAYNAEQEKLGIIEEDREEETSYEAVVYGNLIGAEEKKSVIDVAKSIYDNIQQKQAEIVQAAANGDDRIVKKQDELEELFADYKGVREGLKFKGKKRMEFVMAEYRKLLEEKPGLAKLQDAIAKDYADEFERINRASIEEFNQPVWREKWYLPLIRLEHTGETHEARVRADLLGSASGTGKAGTEKGFTKKRIKIAPENQRPVETGLYKTWVDSVNRTEHFIAYASYVRELNRVFENRDATELKMALQNRYGRAMTSYIDSYIKEVANPDRGEPTQGLDKLVRTLRGNVAPAYLAWKASSIIKQGLSSPAPFAQFITPAEYLNGAMALTHKETREAINEKSAFMKNRVMDPMVDIIKDQELKAHNKVAHALKTFESKGMAGLEWIDYVCVAPGWYAIYKKTYNEGMKTQEARYQARVEELEELNEGRSWKDKMTKEELRNQAMEEVLDDIELEAVNKADDCVRLCQPSNRKTDLAPLFKNGNEIQKALLQFTTSLNVIWQNIRYDIPYAVRQKQFRNVVTMILGYAAAGLAMGIVCDGLGGDDEDEAEKLRKLVYYSTTQFTDSIPVLGAAITSASNRIITGEKGFMNNGSDLFPTFTKLKEGAFALTEGNIQKAASKLAEGFALSTGLPVSATKELLYASGITAEDDEVHPEAIVGRREE